MLRRRMAAGPGLAVAAALTLLFTGLPGASGAGATPDSGLTGELEEVRAAQATELYGDPAVRPRDERRTSVISLGDSEISGEGAGNYEPGTDGPDNWCHRSLDAAIHRTGIPVDETYNVSCSGASTANIRIGGQAQYADEQVQSDSLAVVARNTDVETIVLVAGANDDLQFGPVITDCVMGWFLFWQGPCAPKYDPGWQDRVDGLRPKLTATITDLRTVMTDAGYAEDDYELVVMGYPSPIGPDFEDNPRYPGKLAGGCTGYTSDAAWGRDTAVPAFQEGVRRAALDAGATYLDASRLFHGHEVCSDNTWVSGLTVNLTNPFPPDSNSLRQSFHPNTRGHAAFASCLTQLHGTGLAEASCADPASTGSPELYPFAWDDAFAPRRNDGTGTCLAVTGDGTRNGSPVGGAACDGSRAQDWWQDEEFGSLHTELTHDRCLDVPSGRYRAGQAVQLYDCHGGDNQRFVTGNGTISPAAAPGLCATLTGPTARLTLQRCDGSPAQRFV
ncbi:ricin-type beta-trefoil lectin domain protein [Streptomyces specialis]|uniref:ricin-type beta-trefoil lectin domain protein n=1 Tax=Streptomyces specialis TaxID=498367 RepID=UPI00073F020E|nr:ricin-type beta-trefoil lectin domain protein [Streptomyces specialis]